VNNETNSLDDLVKISFFSEIGKEISSAKTIDEVVKAIMKKIGEIFAPLNWSLLLKDKKTEELYFKLIIGEGSDTLKDLRIPKGQGIANWIMETGQAAIVKDVKKDSRFCDMFDKISSFKTESIIGVPLKSNDQVIGVIELVNKINERPFIPTDLKVLSTIADFAAIAIEKVYYLHELERIASIDPLTGLYNRRTMEALLISEIERVKRYKHKISLLMLDVDDFKKINDSYGHLHGDKVLKALAVILKKDCRKSDIIARFGGDEFIVIMPFTDKDAAGKLKKRIKTDIGTHNKKHPKYGFEVSIGVDSAGPDSINDLMKSTDINLYKEKEKKEMRYIKEIEEKLRHM